MYLNPAHGELGSRVRQARRAQGLTQLDLAGRLERSESWVRGVERGRLVLDRRSVIDRVADILKVDVSWLLGQPYEPQSPAQDAGHQAVPALRAAIRRSSLILSGHPGISAETPSRSLFDVRHRVNRLTRLRQAANLPGVMAGLPATIEDINTLLLHSDGSEIDSAYVLLVESSHIARMVLNQLGHHDLAWTAVENAASAATQLGDDLIKACSAWDRCGVLLHTGSLRETISVAEAALGGLDHRMSQPSPAELSLWGALQLRCAVASSRRHDEVASWQYLAEAEQTAARIGQDRNDFQTVFGPTNVQIHAVELAVELGNPEIALRRARNVSIKAIPSRERIVHHGIDIARAHGQSGQDAIAIHELTSVSEMSPHYVHNHPMARALVTQVLQRSRSSATETELGSLARAMNIA